MITTMQNGTVTIDHATQTFNIDDLALNKNQALTIAIALISYYEEHDYIDSKGELWDVREHLKIILGS